MPSAAVLYEIQLVLSYLFNCVICFKLMNLNVKWRTAFLKWCIAIVFEFIRFACLFVCVPWHVHVCLFVVLFNLFIIFIKYVFG